MRLAVVRAHAHVHHLHHLHDGLEHAEVGGERVGGEGPTAPGGSVRVVVDGPVVDESYIVAVLTN